MSNIDELERRIMSMQRLIVVETDEEERFLRNVFERFDKSIIYTWTPTLALRQVLKEEDFHTYSTGNASEAALFAAIREMDVDQKTTSTTSPTLYILRDLVIGGQGSHRVARGIKDLLPVMRKTVIIITGHNVPVSPVLDRDYHLLSYSLKEKSDLEEWLGQSLETWKKSVESSEEKLVWINGERIPMKDAYKLKYTKREVSTVASALSGLTENESRVAVTYSMKTTGKMSPRVIADAKRNIVEKSGLLEWVVPNKSESVGGMDILKAWLERRADAMGSDKALKYGLPPPKGVMLIGPPGTGKSLICKQLSLMWDLPLIRMDVGRLMERWVGSSEGNMRSALSVIEANAPAIVWIDEIEKSMSGVQSSGFSDSGTMARTFGTFLTWAQENTKPIFIAATCNAMIGSNNQLLLPPEFQRKGRFDGIFFIDLPTLEERKEIVRIHIEKARQGHSGRKASDYDVDTIAGEVYGNRYSYTGAEYEAAIIEASYSGFARNEEYTTDDIIKALREMRPVSYMMADTMTKLREFGRDRCSPASSRADESHASADTSGLADSVTI